MANLKNIRIRMYCHGLGDCFLLTITTNDDSKFHMLIDCGVILGTKDPQAIMTSVAEDIKMETNGILNAVVLTHEHWDHLSGFTQARAVFDQMTFKEVWVAWTEDSTNPVAKKLKKERDQRKNGLQFALNKLKVDAQSTKFISDKQKNARLGYLGAVEEVLSFTGFGANAGGSTAEALKYVQDKAERLYYCTPGTPPFTLKGISGLQLYVLGPPEDEKLIKKDLSKKEVYHHPFLSGMGNNFISALTIPVEGEEQIDKYLPFDKYTGIKPVQAPSDLTTYNDPEHEWRKIDNDWLDFSGQLALALDSDTNNTSLVLAFEMTESNEFLLFPGDAQVGNWLSWHKYTWKRKDKTGNVEELDIKKIFERTVFYKVGHHGSHNATLSANGLELMTNKALAVMIPVNQEMAKKKKWSMPFPPLLARLKERSHGRVLIADEKFDKTDGKSPYMSTSEWDSFKSSVKPSQDNLFVDYLIELK